MVKFDVCLEMVFVDLPYERRIERIAAAGFDLVEFWFHDATFDGSTCTPEQAKDPATLRQVCESAGVGVNNMVVNAPDGSFGGTPVNPAELNQYLERLNEVAEFCQAIGCTKAITCSGNEQPGTSRRQMRAALEKALGEAAAVAARKGLTLLLEPLNTHVDHAGYYLDSSSEAAEIVRSIDSPNLRLLYDVYHMQIMEGNVIATIEKNIDAIGHFHAAGVPGRHEITTGELNYRQIVNRIEATGYDGAFGLEYVPAMPDAESLAATRAMLD